MGIKNYLKYIKQEYDQNDNIYDYLYLDCNYLIHYLIYNCTCDNDLYKKVVNYLKYLLSKIIINKSIYLIFDGKYDTEILENPKYYTHQVRAKTKNISEDYDKQKITPDSIIIESFKGFLISALEKQKKLCKYNYNIEINDYSINGEADIKILNLIYTSEQNNICICSKDSDMILIAQSISVNKIIKINVISNLIPIKIVNMNEFKKYNLDYILITLLLGNDYLPKISNVNYLTLIDAYEKYINFNSPIIFNNILNQNNLITYIGILIISLKKKTNFDFKKLNYDKFKIYYNNLCWCLKYYKVIENNNNFIQDITGDESRTVINIYNFINYRF